MEIYARTDRHFMERIREKHREMVALQRDRAEILDLIRAHARKISPVKEPVLRMKALTPERRAFLDLALGDLAKSTYGLMRRKLIAK